MPNDITTTSTGQALPAGTADPDLLDGASGNGDGNPSQQTAEELPDDPVALKALLVNARTRQAGADKARAAAEKRAADADRARYIAEGRASAQPVQQPTQPREEPDIPILSAAEAKQLADAYLNGDGEVIARLEEAKAERTTARGEKRLLKHLTTAGQQAQAQQTQSNAFNSYLRGQGIELNTPAAALATEKYQAVVRGERPDLVALGNGNPLTIMAFVALEAKNEVISKEGGLRNSAPRETTEPSGGGATGVPGNSTPQPFSYMKHLFEQERAYTHADGSIDHKKTWALMERRFPGMQAARLKAGRPLTSLELKLSKTS